MPSASPSVLVVGCGGLGGILTARLMSAGVDVTAVTSNAAIAESAKRDGLIVGGVDPLRLAPDVVGGRVVDALPIGRRFDFIVLATQPPQVEAAAAQAAFALADDGAMVCLQNGLCESRVAAVEGVARGSDSRTIGAVVAWGATMSAPARYEQTARGGFTVGVIDSGLGAGVLDARVASLATTLGRAFPTEVTSNLAGKRWSKLAINCAISSLGTLAGLRLGEILRHRFIRALAIDIMREAVEVAERRGVVLTKVSGTIDLRWIAREDRGRPDIRVGKHALLIAVGLGYRNMRSSMLAAIERGRTPAIDFLNGEIVDNARALGMGAPINRAVVDAVWSIARKETTPSIDRVAALYDATRAAPTPKA